MNTKETFSTGGEDSGGGSCNIPRWFFAYPASTGSRTIISCRAPETRSWAVELPPTLGFHDVQSNSQSGCPPFIYTQIGYWGSPIKNFLRATYISAEYLNYPFFRKLSFKIFLSHITGGDHHFLQSGPEWNCEIKLFCKCRTKKQILANYNWD